MMNWKLKKTLYGRGWQKVKRNGHFWKKFPFFNLPFVPQILRQLKQKCFIVLVLDLEVNLLS